MGAGDNIPSSHVVEVRVSDLNAMTNDELIAFAETEMGFYLSPNADKETNLTRIFSHGQ